MRPIGWAHLGIKCYNIAMLSTMPYSTSRREEELKNLARQIEPKVYEYGFLKR